MCPVSWQPSTRNFQQPLMSNFLNVMFTISGLSFSDRIAIWRSNKNPALPVAVVTVLEGISIYFSFCKLGFTNKGIIYFDRV